MNLESVRDLEDLSTHDRRVRLAGIVLINSYNYELKQEIVQKGFREFYRVAKSAMSGHGFGFNTDDYRTIFDMIARSIKQVS